MKTKQCVLLFFVLAVAMSAGSAYAINFIVNPGFEDGTGTAAPPWSYWGGTGGAVANPLVNSDNPSARVWSNFNSYSDVAAQNDMGNLWLGPGDTYHVHAQFYIPAAQVPSGKTMRAGVQIRFQDGTANVWVLDPTTTDAAITAIDSWVTFDFNWTYTGSALAHANYMPFYVRAWDGSALSSDDTGGYFDNLQFSSDQYRTFSGVVKNLTNQVIAGATVTVTTIGGVQMATATTDQNGQYAITTMLPYGDYSVMATCPSYMASDTLYLTLNAGTGAVNLTLGDYIAISRISGKVSRTDGTGISGVSVSVATTEADFFGPNSVNTTTDANGNYSVNVVPDMNTRVKVGKLPWAPAAGTTSWPAPTMDQDGYPQDQVVNIQLVNGKLVDIDASGLTAGSINTWVNNGAYGGSFKISAGANPTAGLVGYYKAVTFAGSTGMMLKAVNNANILTDAFLSGNPNYTVSAWIYNPAIADEEAYLCWAHRGGTPDASCAQFNYGTNGVRGAATHWGDVPDMAWSATVPAAAAWHHVVVSFDGVTERVYVDGVLANSEAKTLAIWPTNPIQIGGSYTNADGTGYSNGFDGSVSRLQVYGAAATAADVAALYADAPPSQPALSGVVSDSSGPVANAYVRFGGASGQSMITGADGAFKFPILRAGTFELLANASGHNASIENIILTGTVNVTHPVTLTLTNLAVPRTSDILFGCLGDDLPASGAITTWPTAYPAGGSLTAMAGTTPIAESVVGKTWEQNLYLDGDGLQYGNAYTSSIPVNGASIVAMVKPIRNTTATSWISVVDIFGDRLVLGIRNDLGRVCVRRNGSTDVAAGTTAIPTGQTTVLTLVVQPDGTYKVWANGTQIMDKVTNGAFMSLVPNVTNANFHFINVGRGSYYSSTAFNGNIADFFVYKVALSDAERGGLEVGLAAKYGVPPWAPSVVNVANIAGIKAQPAGTLINLSGTETVIYAPRNSSNARSTTFFYIAEKMGIAGLKVVDKTSDTLTLGNRITSLSGYVRKPAGGEVYLELTADPTGSGNTPILPIGANNKVALTEPKVLASAITVWGKVETSSPTTFTINDGYGPDITVNVNGIVLPTGFGVDKYVAVNGVLSVDKTVQAQSVRLF